MLKFLRTNSEPAIIIIRILCGFVFISEGIQKFLFPEALGIGRFEKIGIPLPGFFAPFVGVTEIICGGLVFVGLLTRVSVIPLIIDMIVAIISTKLPILLEKGFWSMEHEARTDISMLLCCIFLLFEGPGLWSVDYYLSRKL